MSRFEKFKEYFNKKNFDYSHGEINPYEFHTTFYLLTRIFRLVDNDPLGKWTIAIPISVIFCAVTAAALCFISLVHYIIIFEVNLSIEMGTYFLTMVYKLLIISCTLTDRPHYHKLLKAMQEDYHYICTKGSKYREKFFENHLGTWKASIAAAMFIAFIGGSMMMCANIALLVFLIYKPDDGIRPLPFPFWCFDVDFGKSPTYEIVFLFSIMVVATYVINYIFMMQTQIVWIRQIMSKADVIIWSIEDLLVDVKPTDDEQQKKYYCEMIKTRMAEIIKMHHSMYSLLDDYAAVYRKLLMYEQKLVAPIVCSTSYAAVEKYEANEFSGILILLCTAAIFVAFIPSYMCTVLSEKVQSIRDACWNTPFWNAPGKVIRPYYILIMQRSLRRLPIQSPGFEEVSLQTFSDKMSLAYTGFNMLRQS